VTDGEPVRTAVYVTVGDAGRGGNAGMMLNPVPPTRAATVHGGPSRFLSKR
jgi:hypothetical protein